MHKQYGLAQSVPVDEKILCLIDNYENHQVGQEPAGASMPKAVLPADQAPTLGSNVPPKQTKTKYY